VYKRQAPDYLNRYGTPQTPGDLADHNLIAFGTTDPTPLHAKDGQTGAFDPGRARNRLILDDGHSQKIAALSGLGICQTALWTTADEIRDGRLIRVLPEWDVASDTALWLVYPNSNIVSAKVRVFMDVLLEKIGRAPPWLQAQTER